MDICRVCGDILDGDNWCISNQKKNIRICNKCNVERVRLWRRANPERVRKYGICSNRAKGHQPMSENRECASFLGVHVAERVLSHVFNDVEVMPYGNPGYDIKCNRDKLIDIKSSCLMGEYPRWSFSIRHNTIPDYFICLAFDNRESLTPMYVWLIPGNNLNNFTAVSISPSTVSRWSEYELDINEVISCCNEMKEYAQE